MRKMMISTAILAVVMAANPASAQLLGGGSGMISGALGGATQLGGSLGSVGSVAQSATGSISSSGSAVASK